MTITIDIPALDRMCAILENRQRGDITEEMKSEIVSRLEDAAKTDALEKAAKTATEEAAVEAQNGPAEPPPEPTNVPDAPEPPKPATAPVTLDAVQRAAAQMRDEGKLGAVTGMFGEFGIRKLSDLTGDKLQKFGDRLRKMGAKI